MKQIFRHELISGASLVFAGGLLASLLNFFFNLFMARNLSPSDYGTLASLVSLLTLSTLPIGALMPAIIYFSASYFAKGELAQVRGLFLKITKASIGAGTIMLILYIIFGNVIAEFLKISDSSLIIPIALGVFWAFVGVANVPLLQAKLSFKFISIMILLGAFFKLAIGMTLVLLGFSIGGAIWGLFLAGFIPYLMSFFELKFLFMKSIKTPHISLKSFLAYGTPAMLATFGLTSLITTDIIIVKHFLDPVSAGVYATISLVGRVIFYFSAPIGTVMFPLIAQKHARGEYFHNTFKLSLLIVLLPSLSITMFYFFFPAFSIEFFSKNKEYLAGTGYLGLFGVFITMYALLSIVTNFYLSIKKTNVFIPIVIGAIAQAVFLWIYHESFLQIILVSTIIAGLLLLSLLLYYWKLYANSFRYHSRI